MTNLRTLDFFNPRHQRNGDTIRILTDLLQRAQQGEIQEIAIAWINDQEACSNLSSCSVDTARLIGAVVLMQHHMASVVVDNAIAITAGDQEEDDPA